MTLTKIIVELEYKEPFDVSNLRINIERLLIEKQIQAFCIYQEK